MTSSSREDVMSVSDATGRSRGTPRRRATARPVLVAAVLALCWPLAACSASQNDETQREIPDTAGVDASVGSVVLDDVFLDTATTVPAGGSVPLRAALTDDSDQPDRLLAVSSPSATSVALLDGGGAPSPGGIELPAEGSVDATTGPVRLLMEGLTAQLDAQGLVPVTFEFEHAGRVTVMVPAATPQE
jgi:periplasmic copper chaperone A